MTDNMHNEPEYFAFGYKAGEALKAGAAATEQGSQMTVLTFMTAIKNGHECVASVYNRKGVLESQHSFTIDDFANKPPMTEANKTDRLAVTARYKAVASELFGLDGDIAGNLQSLLTIAAKTALYLVGKGYVAELPEEGESAADYRKRLNPAKSVGWNKSAKRLIVPYAAVVAPPKPDASDNARTTYKAMCATSVELDRKKHEVSKTVMSFRELQNRASPPKASPGSSTPNPIDRAKSLAASLVMIRDYSSRIAKGEALEIDPAPGNDLRKAMMMTMKALEAYFAVDPIEDEKAKPQDKAA